jgi:hypothetical protein
MSDQQQPTPIDVLVDRLGTKIAQLTIENEWLRVQLEAMQQQQQQESEVNPNLNGEHITDDTHEGVAPI